MNGIDSVFDVGARALSAQMVRMNTVASNLANAGTVSDKAETAFRPLRPVFETSYADAVGRTGLSTRMWRASSASTASPRGSTGPIIRRPIPKAMSGRRRSRSTRRWSR